MILENHIHSLNKEFERLDGKKNIVVWGCIETTSKLLEFTRLLKYAVRHYVDKSFAGMSYFGKIIESPERICWEEVDGVVISAVYSTEQIKRELMETWAYRGDIIEVNKRRGGRQFYQYAPEREYLCRINGWQNEVLASNEKYKDLHRGERVFILCCGPSINQLDLQKLFQEKAIAVSDFFLHQDYEKIAPAYYCRPKLEDYYPESGLAGWQEQFKKYIGETQLFFDIDDYDLFYGSDILPREKLNFVSTKMRNSYFAEIDLKKNIMGPQSVSILALQIAIYMGFSRIYLLGAEHDSMITKKYEHFFDKKESMFTMNEDSADEDDNIILPFKIELEIQNCLWKQYATIKEIAEEKGISIYNATPGGVLDVFERVDFDTLFSV